MSGLFSSLRATVTALNAQSQAIAVTGSNIGNINNPNYSRETVAYGSLGTVDTSDGPQSVGVSVSVQQMRNVVLDQMVRQEAALTSGFTAQQDILSQAQASLGESVSNSSSTTSANSNTTTNSGLGAAIDDFFNAVQSFAANPTDAGQRQALVQQAGVLTDRFKEIDTNLAQVQANAGAKVAGDVGTANQLVQQIAQLNSQIASVEINNPGSAVSLRDQRAGDLEKLSALVPITAQENAQGEVKVSTTDTGGNPVVLVDQGSASGPLTYAGGVISAGSPSTALGLSSGSIEGTLAASAGAVQSLRTSLDQLAGQIVTAVNAAYNPAQASGGNFFNASGTTAGTIGVNPALNAATLRAGTAAAGDNTLALAVAAVASHGFSTGGGDAINGTIGQFYAGTVSGIGQALDTANTQVTDQTNVQSIVKSQRASVSGVSVDEEMANLMTYQRAYQASSQVFSVINTLLNNLVTQMG